MGSVRSGILSLALKDVESLYASYMPFVKNGGLFVPTRKDYLLGDEVFVLLELMDEPEKNSRSQGKLSGSPRRAPALIDARVSVFSCPRKTPSWCQKSKPTSLPCSIGIVRPIRSNFPPICNSRGFLLDILAPALVN